MDKGTGTAVRGQDGPQDDLRAIRLTLESINNLLAAVAQVKVRPRKRASTEAEQREREQKACLLIEQIGANKTRIAAELGCSRGTLDSMKTFNKMYRLMCGHPVDRRSMSDNTDATGAKTVRYRRDRSHA